MASQQYVKIQNTLNPEGQVFHLCRETAEQSFVIRTLLSDFAGTETDFNETVIPISVSVSDAALAKAFEWASHKSADNQPAAGPQQPTRTTIQVTPWDEAFFGAVDAKMLYELLLATNYLEIKVLYDMCCLMVVRMIRGKNADEIREALGLNLELTPEQEAAQQETFLKVGAWNCGI